MARPTDGVAEVGYGVDDDEQRQGFATEGTRACVEWALTEPGRDRGHRDHLPVAHRVPCG
jgi:RimJ/RimL family protein N-acetyltransferase